MKRIRCPIHNYITLMDRDMAIVDLPVFQRLRGIKQLGMAYLVYPGARHTRFEHSLGVYHLGGIVSDMLRLSPEEKDIILLSGLLHDIGHGPFSHIMESVSPQTHEERSAKKVKNGDIADILNDFSISPETVADTIMGISRLSAFISSEIDIDRMDYLLRDAHYTGVTTGVDAGRLTAVMEMESGSFVFRETGLGAVEALLIARFLMYSYVYFHHTARAAERMLARALSILIRDGERSEEELWEMDDIGVVAMLRGHPGLPGELMRQIDERRLYKRGWEEPLVRFSSIADSSLSMDRLLLRLRDFLSDARLQSMEIEIAENLDIEPERVIVDVPFPPEINTGRINIKKRHGEIVTGRSISRVISMLEKAQLDHWQARVFIPEEERERAYPLLQKLMPEFIQFWDKRDWGQSSDNC